MRRLHHLIALAAILALFGCAAGGGPEGARLTLAPATAPFPEAPLEPGAKIPAMTLDDLGGAPHDIAEALGRGPVGIFFWSVFCSNCKEAMPELIQLQNDRKEEGFVVWAINVDGDRFSNAVEGFVRETDLPFFTVYDRLEGEVLVAADPLGVTKTPTFFLVDRSGTITQTQAMVVDVAKVREALDALE